MLHMHPIITRILPALLPALLLTACNAADTDAPSAPEPDTSSTPGYILFGYGAREAGISWLPSAESRAGTPQISAMPEAVGIFGYNDFSGGQSYQGGGEVFDNVRLIWRYGPLFPESGILDWYTNPGTDTPNDWAYDRPMPWLCEEDGVKYKFFAYTPYTPYSAESRDIEAFGRSYDAFESVEWHHVPKYSPRDYMVSDRIVEYTSLTSGNTLQVMSMQHLQARVRFCFKLGPNFSAMRMVRVKQLEVVTPHGFLYTLTARYAPVEEMGVQVLRPTLVWTIEDGADDSDFTLSNEPDPATLLPVSHVDLTRDCSEYQAVASLYAYPGDGLSALQLRVTYDVYDYYPGHEPRLLRENDSAVNTVPLSFRASNATTGTGPKFQAGYYYDVNITVEPDYLYVLSDNDFDADGYFIIADD